MHSNGVSSKEQLEAQTAPNNSELVTAQQDLTAGVDSSSSIGTQQQEGLHEQEGQAEQQQQQQQQPCELQMQEGEYAGQLVVLATPHHKSSRSFQRPLRSSASICLLC